MNSLRKRRTLGFAMTMVLIFGTKADSLSGFYIGANVGGGAILSKYNYSNGQNGLIAGEVSGNARNYSYATSVGITGGYNHTLTPYLLLGAELFIDAYLGNAETTSRNESIKIKSKGNNPLYGFLVRASYVASSKSLVYFGIGGKLSKFTYKIMGTEPPSLEASISQRSFKPLIELGYQRMFNCNHLGWRISYNCAFGQDVKIKNFPRNHALNQAGASPSAKFSSTEHGVKLGAFYNF